MSTFVWTEFVFAIPAEISPVALKWTWFLLRPSLQRKQGHWNCPFGLGELPNFQCQLWWIPGTLGFFGPSRFSWRVWTNFGQFWRLWATFRIWATLGHFGSLLGFGPFLAIWANLGYFGPLRRSGTLGHFGLLGPLVAILAIFGVWPTLGHFGPLSGLQF